MVTTEASRKILAGPEASCTSRQCIPLDLACEELQAAMRTNGAEHLQAGIRSLVKHMAGAPRASNLDQACLVSECGLIELVTDSIMTGLVID